MMLFPGKDFFLPKGNKKMRQISYKILPHLCLL